MGERRSPYVDFRAPLNSDYRVQSYHGEYFYFSGMVSADEWPRTSKTVLLVEKGAKIRVEDVKEGEGGEIVDN